MEQAPSGNLIRNVHPLSRPPQAVAASATTSDDSDDVNVDDDASETASTVSYRARSVLSYPSEQREDVQARKRLRAIGMSMKDRDGREGGGARMRSVSVGRASTDRQTLSPFV